MPLRLSRWLSLAFVLWLGLSPAHAQAPPLLVGGSLSLQGKHQNPSSQIRPALEMWAEEVNQAGGLLGRPVKLVVRDDQSREDLVRRHYAGLVEEERADLLFAPYSSALTLAALEVSEPKARLLVGFGASSDEIWEKGPRFCFGIYSTASRYFIGFLDLAARQGLKTVGVVHEASSFPQTAAKGARDWAERFGMRVALFEGFRDGPGELPRLLAKAKAQGIEALVLAVYHEESLLAVKEFSALGWRPAAVAMSTGPASPEFYAQAGQGAEGVFGPSQWEPDLRIPFPGAAAFIDGYAKRTGRLPSYHATSAYAGLTILAQAVARTGSLDQERLRATIWGLDTLTVMGRFKVDASGKQVGHTPLVIQWQEGKKEIVYPPRMLTAPPRF